MLKKLQIWMLALGAVLALTAPMAHSQTDERDDSEYDRSNYRSDDRGERTRIDRYLDAEIWTNHSDDEFYIGDNIVVNYRVNRDAFVAIYSLDTRGRVRLLFPTGPNDDNYVRAGVTNHLPSGSDNYDLEVTGPAGTEYIQIVASQERFPIPDWYEHGLKSDASDRDEYLDYLNSEYFVRYNGQRFAYDRVRVYVDEWEEDYFRPIYHPVYPHWSVCGNAYFDYPWGSTVYIDGIYWGCTPLYCPEILIGWHTVTVYDPWGYCWEDDIHIHRYNTVVLDRTVIVPRQTVVSKYKEVRLAGYRDPVSNGYPKFKDVVATKVTVRTGNKGVFEGGAMTRDKLQEIDKHFVAPSKKYARAVTPLEKTTRGYETTGPNATDESGSFAGRKSARTSGTPSSLNPFTRGEQQTSDKSSGYRREPSKYESDRTTQQDAGALQGESRKESTPSDYYQKKSGESTWRRSGGEQSGQKSGSETQQKNDRPVTAEKKKTSSDDHSSGRSEAGNKQSSGSTQQSQPPQNKPSGNDFGGKKVRK